MPTEEPQRAAEHSPDRVGAEEAAQAMRDGPIGAYIVASIAVEFLFLGWLAF